MGLDSTKTIYFNGDCLTFDSSFEVEDKARLYSISGNYYTVSQDVLQKQTDEKITRVFEQKIHELAVSKRDFSWKIQNKFVPLIELTSFARNMAIAAQSTLATARLILAGRGFDGSVLFMFGLSKMRSSYQVLKTSLTLKEKAIEIAAMFIGIGYAITGIILTASAFLLFEGVTSSLMAVGLTSALLIANLAVFIKSYQTVNDYNKQIKELTEFLNDDTIDDAITYIDEKIKIGGENHLLTQNDAIITNKTGNDKSQLIIDVILELEKKRNVMIVASLLALGGVILNVIALPGMGIVLNAGLYLGAYAIMGCLGWFLVDNKRTADWLAESTTSRRELPLPNPEIPTLIV